MQIAKALRLLLFTVALLVYRQGFALIAVDSVVTQPSNCANDGSITVYAQSPSPMLYALIAGPEIRPVQSGRLFAALARGNYQVRITNFSNDTLVVSATVGGNYSFPDFAPAYSEPLCFGTATGIIACNPLNAGTPPFTWVLTDLGNNQTITQSSDTFFNVPSGSYSIRQFDSCQSFATRYLTVGEPFHDFFLSNLNNLVFGCDSVLFHLQIFLQGGNYALPYTIQLQTPHGTYQHIINPAYLNGTYSEVYERIGGLTYGDYCNVTVTDACGRSQYMANTISPFTPHINFAGNTDSCQARFAAYCSIGDPNNPTIRPTYMNAPVTVALYTYPGGLPVDSVVSNGIDSSIYIAYSTYHQAGEVYTVRVSDACGYSYTQVVQWPALPAPAFTHYFTGSMCRDSTIGFSLEWDNYFYSIPTFELISGPDHIGSTKPHYQYHDTVIYPQRHLAWRGGNNGTGSYQHYTEIANLGLGTYHYHVFDSCGHSITDSFTVLPQDVNDLHYTFKYTRGCPGQNTITMSHTTNAYDYVTGVVQGNNIPAYLSYLPYDTIRNLNSGTYYLQYNYYRNCCNSIGVNQDCNFIFDTLVIPAYDLPKIDYATQVKCNGTVNVGLQPDSAKGIPPYSYEILSGPQTASVQPSNFFTLTQPGTYTARISDVCGFARTFTFSVDTLDFQQIVKVGSSCVGNSAALVCQHSPYATYIWQRPDGTFYTGDSLLVSPVTANDYGVYNVTKIVSVNACRDTFYTTYTLTSSSVSYTYATICSGGSVVFNGRTLTQAGIYYDTIPGALCDSMVVLNLTVAMQLYDSVSRTICAGQSVTVGSHTYNTTGVYRDTLTTAAGCDSIHVLNLLTVAYLRDSVTQTLCPGYNVTNNGHTYTRAGVYRDTITGSGVCDSIFILNLLPGQYKTDSVEQFICYGQSVSSGGHVYTTTGIYRDTLATIGCDSIHIINLHVGAQMRDSVYVSLCSGQAYTVGGHVYSTTGVYRDTFNVNGCDSIFILNLRVDNFKRDSVARTICAGESITLSSGTYSSSGVYRDTFNTIGCDSIFIVRLTVLPVATATLNQTLCSNQSITIGTHSYSNSGIYHDTLTAATGCDSLVTLNLQVLPAAYDSINIGFCEGDSAMAGNGVYYTAGLYTDTLTTANGCDSILKVNVTTYALPAVQVSATSATITRGDTVQLNANGSLLQQYFWQGNAAYNNAFISNPVATVNEPGWLVVQVTNANSCTAADSVYIDISDCREALFVPNAFTPNGDGQNDVLKVLGRCVILHSFRIFNRWGELVYETDDITHGWDGTFKGAAQMPGVYVYLVEYFADNPNDSTGRLLKGSVSLIR